MFEEKHCNICLKPKKALFSILQCDVSNTTYLDRLQFAVPEIQWDENYFICLMCIDQVNNVIDFKNLCLKSIQSTRDLKPAIEKNAISDNEPYDDDDGDDNKDGFSEDEDDSDKKGSNIIMSDDLKLIRKQSNIEIVECDEDDDKPLARLLRKNRQKVKSEVSVKKEIRDPTPIATLEIDDFDSYFTDFKFKCEYCSARYKSRILLEYHTTAKHKDKSTWEHNCFSCDKVYPRKNILVAHIKCKHLEEGEFVCFYCEKIFDMKHLLFFHIIERHQKTNPDTSTSTSTRRKRCFDCEGCGRVFGFRNQLYEHALNAHGLDKDSLKPYKCEVCDKRFKVSSYLNSHKLYHEGKRSNICNVCGKGFITIKDLKMHETYHSQNFKYNCADCDQTFKNHKLLYSHRIAKHVDPEHWKFCCEICGKKFPRVSNFKMHVRRHMGDKQFGCHLCEKRFVSKFQMLRHVESHSNVKQFHCKLCGKEYREKRIYNIHLLDVHGIGNTNAEKILCHICTASFSCNYKLRRHVLKHFKPYECTMCDKKYPDNYHLKQHLKNKHNIIQTKPEGSDLLLKTDLLMKAEPNAENIMKPDNLNQSQLQLL